MSETLINYKQEMFCVPVSYAIYQSKRKERNETRTVKFYGS